MKRFLFLIVVLLIVGCGETKVDNGKSFEFFVGTYTEGNSEGIYKYKINTNGKLDSLNLVAKSNGPSFIASYKNYLIAVNELAEGTVESYSIKNNVGTLLNRQSSGGAHPCFVAVNNNGYVLTANYTGGNVGLLKVEEDGNLSDLLSVQQHTGHGTTDRQKAPHAHSAWFVPGSNEVIAVDLGTNELWFSKLDEKAGKLVPAEQAKLKFEDGAGPRHLCFHPNGKWIYVVNELNSTITLVLKEKGEHYLGESASSLPAEFDGASFCGDIHISSDGRFVYASNRGDNSISILEVNKSNGTLTLKGTESVRGSWPRNFTLTPDENYVLVANQKTDNIVSYKRDKTTGMLTYVDEITAPTPVCLVF